MISIFKKLQKPVLLVVLFVCSLGAMAQTGAVRGFVYDKKTGEPIIFTNVYLDGTNYGIATDVNGYFSLTKVPPGNYKLTVYTIGYDKFQENVDVLADKIVNRKIYLEVSSAKEIGTVEISAEKQEAKTDVKMSVAKITPKEIKSLPSVGGEPDLAQYLQVLPGVIFTGDQGGQLYVRGGSPIQNKVMLDGMVIYNPFHSIGLYSVFDTDVIRNADVYTGGFGAKYGGRISAVMDITTRDGNKNNLSGKINVSPFGVKALFEGPLKKMSENGGSSSFILSMRNSYLKQTSKIFYNYVNKDGEGLPFNFSDAYGKLSFNSGSGSKINFFGFNFTDKVRYQGVSDLGWTNYGAGSSFILAPPGNPVLIEGNFSYSKYSIALKEPGLSNRQSDISGFNFGFDVTNYQGNNELKFGLQVLGFATDFSYFNSIGVGFAQNENTTEFATYTSYKLVAGLLVIEPSVRLHYYASLSEMPIEPRLGLKYNITEFIRFKAAGGLYSQNLISANSDRDVVNLFYGFLSGPENLPNYYTKPNGEVAERTTSLQKATHYITGFEFDVTKNLNVNIEGYYKIFNQLTNTNRNKLYPDDVANENQPEALRKDYIIETGIAKGVDFVAKYTLPSFSFYAVYSLSKVDRNDGFQVYFPVFDRRHNINTVATYNFGKNHSWEVSGRWNFGSGFPFTQTKGYYESLNFSGGAGTDPGTTQGNLGVLYGDFNKGRLPTYHRLDLSIKKTIKMKARMSMEIGGGVSNAYNRENLFYFDRVRFQRVNQLPILPSINFSFIF